MLISLGFTNAIPIVELNVNKTGVDGQLLQSDAIFFINFLLIEFQFVKCPNGLNGAVVKAVVSWAIK